MFAFFILPPKENPGKNPLVWRRVRGIQTGPRKEETFKNKPKKEAPSYFGIFLCKSVFLNEVKLS